MLRAAAAADRRRRAGRVVGICVAVMFESRAGVEQVHNEAHYLFRRVRGTKRAFDARASDLDATVLFRRLFFFVVIGVVVAARRLPCREMRRRDERRSAG